MHVQGEQASRPLQRASPCAPCLGPPVPTSPHPNPPHTHAHTHPPHPRPGHIDMWRRHGSVYKTRGRAAAAAADPYEAVREALSKHRRQELFSFAAAQLLVMGTPERAALLLRWGGSSLAHINGQPVSPLVCIGHASAPPCEQGDPLTGCTVVCQGSV